MATPEEGNRAEQIFQEQIATAIALSLEQEVLDKHSRERKYGKSASINSTQYQSHRNTHGSFSEGTVSLPNNRPLQQQRHSDSSTNAVISTPLPLERSVTPPDLISFPTDLPKNPANSSFEKLIEDLQKIPTANTQTALMPLGPTAAAPNLKYGYNSQPIAAAYPAPQYAIPGAAASMQVVPYTPAPSKVPLTNEDLQKLYSAPPPQPMGFVAPNYYSPYPRSASVMGGTGAARYSTGYAAQQYPVPYGFSYNTIPTHAPSPPNYPTAALPGINVPAFNNAPTYTSQNTTDYVTANGSGSTAGSSFSGSSGSLLPVPWSTPPARKQQAGGDLIDLRLDDDTHVNVLQAFDPLLNKDAGSDNGSDITFYEEYDPFDVLYGGTQYPDPLYSAVINAERSAAAPNTSLGWRQECIPSDFSPSNAFADHPAAPPPLPPRNAGGAEEQLQSEFGLYPRLPSTDRVTLDRRKTCTRLYDIVTNQRTTDPELLEFYYMVKDLRGRYLYNDELTNVGHVVASEFKYHYPANTSIKIIVHPALNALLPNAEAASSQRGSVEGYGAPVTFTCDIETHVELITSQAFCSLEGQIRGSVDQFVVKPIGVTEWLSPSSKLSQLECVHNSLKLEKDVQLGLCLKTFENMNVIARTERDDLRDANLRPEDILPNEMASTISYDSMKILLEVLETEMDKLESAAGEANARSLLSCSGVVQGVKAICAMLGSIDTLEIAECVAGLKRLCDESQPKYVTTTPLAQSNPEIINDCGDYAEVSLRPRSTLEQIKLKCNELRDGVQQLVSLYSTVFRVEFSVKQIDYATTPIPISRVLTPIVARVDCLHRPPLNWKYDDYSLGVQIVYGTRYISDPEVTRCSNDTSGGLFPRLNFSAWLRFEKNPICTLPREARLIFVIYGKQVAENEPNTAAESERHQVNTELGWCAIQLFDHQREMVCGSYLLSVWPPSADRFLGSAPARGCHPQPDKCPVLSIEIPPYGGRIQFPAPLENPPPAQRYDFKSLDNNLQQELQDTAEQGYSGASDKREVFWEKRLYLQSFPHALPKVLHAAHSWDYASVMDLHSLLHSWKALAPSQALELLLPRYPDAKVREKAVEWISALPNDQLVDYLPQLLQALKYDTYEASPMARFLLCKCLESPRIAHHTYWLIIHSLPGDDPQNSIDASSGANEIDESQITQSRYYRRNKMMLRALLAVCGEKLSERFLTQSMMCKELAQIAEHVKEAKDSKRQNILCYHLEVLHRELLNKPTSLPLGLEVEVTGVNMRRCSYFNSNAVPLKIAYIGPDAISLPAIFKSGDDLQKDMLTIQLIRLMNKMWLAEGLDLKIVTFNCVPTGYKKGMIEMITEAETLKEIQVKDGVTGTLNYTGIAQWLEKQNPSQLEYQRAVRNFTVSCAGYSVATYILGIGDRHNDNIMIKTSGHFFHIDFSKFLGDAQMFGSFKRDRAPFVLTSQMAYVINGGKTLSTKYHNFVDLCCDAFNIVRKHGDLILHMLAFMATAGIPGINAEALKYVREALHPTQSDSEAAATFANLMNDSLKCWFTNMNFFIHGIVNPANSNGGDPDGPKFSFCSKNYTMEDDGRITNVQVVCPQKHYSHEKYYTYLIKIERKGQPDPTILSRTYKEFTELYNELRAHFPSATHIYRLQSGMHVGRSNVRPVAERRLYEIQKFLKSVMQDSSDEIAHSDLVYTFFHPIYRDQHDITLEDRKVRDVNTHRENPYEVGQIKISFQYRRGVFTVMIHHAKGLPTVQGQEPNTYVKCYLKPDTLKVTKRKTKVVRKTCVPSFMETLEYRMPLETIQKRWLHVTVWSHDTLQENELLGGFQIDLSKLDLRRELVDWFHLGTMPRN